MNIEEALRHLPVGRKAKRLRQLWPVIEAKLAEGVLHSEILEALNRNGFELTERTYKSYLYRHRKKQRQAQRRNGAETSPVQEKAFAAAAGRSSVQPQPGRPATFDYDPRGIPDLLK